LPLDPWTQLGALSPEPHYRLMICAHHGSPPSQLLTPSTAYVGGVLACLCGWIEMHASIWFSWCHCYLLSLASVNSHIGFTAVVPVHLGVIFCYATWPTRNVCTHVATWLTFSKAVGTTWWIQLNDHTFFVLKYDILSKFMKIYSYLYFLGGTAAHANIFSFECFFTINIISYLFWKQDLDSVFIVVKVTNLK